MVLAGQRNQQPPEVVTCHGIDAGGRLVEDQQFGLVHHCHGQRKPLAHTKRQSVGQALHHVLQPEALGHFPHTDFDVLPRHVKELGVKHQVLAHREFGVKRERLRHVAHAAAGVDIARIHLLTEQPRASVAGGQQTGQHLHRRGLAAAIGAEESKDLAPPDLELHVVHRDEIAEAHRQVFRFDGDRGVFVHGQRRDHYGLVATLLFLGQQPDERAFEIGGARAGQQFCRRPGIEDLATVHRHQPVEALRFIHIGGGDDHAHARTILANAGDQIPELCACEGIHAGGRLVQNQQVGVVDQRAAKAKLLLHAAGEFAGRAIQERLQTGAAREVVDAMTPLGRTVAEQSGKELQVFLDRQCRVEVLAQPLRHIGDAWADGVAMVLARHVAAERGDRAFLHGPCAGHQRQQA